MKVLADAYNKIDRGGMVYPSFLKPSDGIVHCSTAIIARLRARDPNNSFVTVSALASARTLCGANRRLASGGCASLRKLNRQFAAHGFRNT
jgi:hypothetical protein